MSMRRSTGRDRRASASLTLINIASLYGASGITLDLDASSGTTASLSRLSQWIDLTGNHTMTQATGANQPLLEDATGPDGRPCVRLDSTARYIEKTGMPAITGLGQTLFLVVQCATATDGWGFLRCSSTGSSGFTFRRLTGNRVVQPLASGTLTDGAFSSNFEVISVRTAAASIGTALATKEIYVNGTLQTVSGAANLDQPGAASVMRVGWTTGNGDFRFRRILWCENAMLSQADHDNVVRKLRAQYGI